MPRLNGELVFEAPWQGRALGLAIGVTQALGVDWDRFRQELIRAIAEDPDRAYYDSWICALEAFVVTSTSPPSTSSTNGRTPSDRASASRQMCSLRPPTWGRTVQSTPPGLPDRSARSPFCLTDPGGGCSMSPGRS